ncbi:MAG: protein kinase [Gemmatimonadota bacterium]|nr:MAG: protein kinase [Gemmatimonadota bacterium]
MIGNTISHYRILEKLGEGGMGVVYKAEDTKLKRTVALKFLPAELTKDPEAKERFIHEAQAASALDHSNICTIHEINETSDGQIFIVMACYDGETLEEKIRRGPLKLETALHIAIQIVEGIKEAHDKKIVHRDIKSANIMITSGGQVKVMDFGLAKLRGKTKLTREGTTLGTVAYMSPEQARGEEVDHRSDIWSLGVVLYEMVTGQRPFQGDYDQAVMYSIINEMPESVTGLRTGVPLELERIVFKCLQKDPGERYQTASGLLADFRHYLRVSTSPSISTEARTSKPPVRSLRRKIAGIAGLVIVVTIAAVLLVRQFKTSVKQSVHERKMLVVLPFENLGPPEEEYFADGITEEITSRLASLHGLGVISRTSAFHYKQTDKTISQIGQELKVDYVLEGTVRWERIADGPSRVRVTPQLIRVSDDTHLWTERYDERLEQIFAVQSTIAEEVVKELNVTLLEPERQAMQAKPTENLEAYQAYLRAMSHWSQPGYDVERYGLAIEMFERAVELDSHFVLAYVELASAHGMLYFYLDPSEERLAKAKMALDRAVSLHPDLPQVRLAKGYFHYSCFKEFDRALQEFFAVEKDLPNNSEIQEAIGYIFRRQGKIEKAVVRLERALDLNPQSAHINFQVGETYGALRRYGTADQYFTRAITLAPDSRQMYEVKAENSFKWRGNTHEARSILAQAPDNEKSDVWIQLDLFDRNFNDALDRISSIPLETIELPLDQGLLLLFKGFSYHYVNKPERSRAAFDEARILMEQRLKEVPKSSFCHAILGLALCRLDRKEEAIREGKLAVEITSDDRYLGSTFLEFLAVIYAWVDEVEKAIDLLDQLMESHYYNSVSIWDLKKSIRWDPLRDNPRFQRMIEKYSEVES